VVFGGVATDPRPVGTEADEDGLGAAEAVAKAVADADTWTVGWCAMRRSRVT
jgi:hypothetical protein